MYSPTRRFSLLPGFMLIIAVALLSSAISPIYAQTTDDQALQIARQVVSALNKADYDTVYALFTDAVVKALSKDQLKTGWESLLKTEGTYVTETDHTITTAQGYKVVVLTLNFTNATLILTVVVTDQGRVGGLNSRAVPKFDFAPDEQEVTFKNGEDTIYGTLLIPANAKGKVPAVLLISGSGPTDRDGNSTLLVGKTDSHKQFARILANAGVASLRYDKYTTGKTGFASYAGKLNTLTFAPYVDTAVSGYHFLSSRKEVDPTHMAILGHSEGGLIAILAATQLAVTAQSPVALILAAPLSKSYMVTIREQIAAQYAAAVKAGTFTQQQADDAMAELGRIIAQVSKDGTLPDKVNPVFASLFSPTNNKFLQDVSQHDPAKIAAALPTTLKVLMLCGRKDVQVPCADVQLLADGFKAGGNMTAQFNQLANVDHVFKEITGTPNLATDYTDPTKPFSIEATTLITAFVKTALLP